MAELTIKGNLKIKGWSYRRAAPVLGVTYQYLCDVCNGIHKSRRLSLKIFDLPTYSEFLRISNNRIDARRPRRAGRRVN